MKRLWIGWAIMVVALIAIEAGNIAGIRYNDSESMPRGFWLERAFAKGDVLKDGDVVAVCLEPTEVVRRYIGPGSCPNGLEPLIKSVGAVEGDEVEFGPAGAWINGRKLQNTLPLEEDSTGRPLEAWPTGIYLVWPGQIWLFSEWTEKAFDSRYVGPINVDTIIARGIPLWTWR